MQERRAEVVRKALAVLALVFLVGVAFAGPPQGESAPLEKYARLARGTKKLLVEMKLTGVADAGKVRIVGRGTLWLDTGRGLCHLKATATVVHGGVAHNAETHLHFSAEGSVRWAREKEGLLDVSANRQNGIQPGKCVAADQMGPIIPFFDATFGYPLLQAETVVRKAKSPLDKKDGLDWFKIERKPGQGDRSVFDKLRADEDITDVWLGISPKTGWPMKGAFRGTNESITLEVTKIDLKPDLKGVFDLPAEVQAKLKEKRAQ